MNFIAGHWYCIGFERYSMEDTPRMDWGPIYRYDGNGDWSDDDGRPVESLYDPELRLEVAMDAADAYADQNGGPHLWSRPELATLSA